MKTAEDILREHCIKNSLFFSQDDTDDIIEAMKLYANQKLDQAKHLVSLQETKTYTTPDIDTGFSQGIDAAMDSIISLKDQI